MRNLLLLSNGGPEGKRLHHALSWISEHFNASQESPKTILFVPYALKGKSRDEVILEITQTLAPLGINLVVAPDTVDDPKTLLDGVDGVFVGGGSTPRLLYSLRKTGLLGAIKEKVEAGMPYMGASAGTLVACPTIKTTNDMPIMDLEDLKSSDAMGLVPFQINAHYVDGNAYYVDGGELVPHNGETREKRIAQFHEENDTPVVGIREGAALRIVGNEVTLLGGKPAKIFERDKEPVDVTDGQAITALMAMLESAPEEPVAKPLSAMTRMPDDIK